MLSQLKKQDFWPNHAIFGGQKQKLSAVVVLEREEFEASKKWVGMTLKKSKRVE